MGIQINGQTDTISAVDNNFSLAGNVSVGGILTYEDVTNVDAVGLSTFQAGIHVTGGLVGIGTDNPNRSLTVKRIDSAGAYAEMGASQDGGIRGLQFRSADNGVYKGAIHTLDATSSGGMIALATGGVERVRVNSSGNIGIGTDQYLGFGPELKLFGTNPLVSIEDNFGVDSFTFLRQNSNIFNIITGDGSSNKFKISKTSDSKSTFVGGNLTNLFEVDYLGNTTMIGNVTIADSIIHSGDTNTKIRFPAVDTVTVETSATERLRITSDGQIHLGNGGFGTTKVGGQEITGQDTSATLKLYDTRADMWGMQMRRDTGTGPNGIFVRAGNTSSNYSLYVCGTNESVTHLVCRGDGKVGVGIKNPTGNFEVNGNDGINISNATRTGTSGAQWRLIPHNGGGSATNLRLYEGAGGTEVLNITKDGKIGIGDNSPSQKLNVAGNIMLEGAEGFMYLSNVGTGNAGIYVRGNSSGSFLRSHSTGVFTWEVTGSEKMRLQSGGGISFNGDTAAANALDDYEEGAWVPNVTNGGVNWIDQHGVYTRIGNIVVVNMWLRASGTSSSTGGFSITGLPYASTTTSSRMTGAIRLYNPANYTGRSGAIAWMSGSSTQINCVEIDSNGKTTATNLNHNIWQNGAEVHVTMSYPV